MGESRTVLPGHSYSQEEMQEMIGKMREVNTAFYAAATRTGCHTFIEFCGLQHKFIDLCAASLAQGIEFPMANAHTGIGLAIDEHHIDYLAEKFECLYGPAFAGREKLAQLFVNKVFGRSLARRRRKKMLSDENRVMVQPTLATYHAQGVEIVYVAECCERVHVSLEKQTTCGNCGQPVNPEAVPTAPSAP